MNATPGQAAQEMSARILRERFGDIVLPWNEASDDTRAGWDAIARAAIGPERERIALRMEELAANYPEDVFPPESDSRDAISGTAMRHAYRTAARLIREEA